MARKFNIQEDSNVFQRDSKRLCFESALHHRIWLLLIENRYKVVSNVIELEDLIQSFGTVYEKRKGKNGQRPQCFKISQKVAFNIASEVSYVYILSGQKFIKFQNWSILASFWQPTACDQTVLPDKSVLIGQKLVENAIIQKFK